MSARLILTLRKLFRRFGIAAILVASASTRAFADPATNDVLQFNADIRPILSESCFVCHGPDKNNRKKNLRLDVRDVAIEKGAIKPGHPDESEMIQRIFATNKDELMPPPDSRKSLTPEQKETLKRWIAAGAQYQPHWAYIKPVRPQLPKVKDQKWVKEPVDVFVLAELEKRRISPSPEADKRTLLRRLSLDLIGLPPTPEEVAKFVADKSPKAYEHEVDRLLASPHYGERMAVEWLDLARFTDTVGYHGDQNINDFPYRDYVIDAYNKNKPFDQFTIEQLAGDLLPNPTTEQRIATGFNRLNMVTREGGAQATEYLAKYGADRVRTVSTTWLGSTMGCCECHDHKFDPFSTKDFYSMKAFFADVKQWGVYSEYNYTKDQELKGFGNDHPFPPEIIVDSPYLHRKLDGVDAEIATMEKVSAAKLKSDAKAGKAFDDWCAWSAKFLKANPDGWLTPKPEIGGADKTGTNKTLVVNADNSVVLMPKASEDTELKLPMTNGWVAALRVELLPSAEHDGKILRATKDSAMVNVSAVLSSSGGKKWEAVSFYHAEADRKDERYNSGSAIIGVEGGWKTSEQFEKSPQTAVWLLDTPIHSHAGDELIIHIKKNPVGALRISVTPFAAMNPLKSGANPTLVKALDGNRSRRIAQIYGTYLASTGLDEAAFENYKALYRDALQYRDGKSPTVVTVAWKPVETRVLRRGNFQDEGGEIVQPEVPHFLPQIADPDGHRLTRLDLAKWIVSRDNPLTARTVMNRMWKQFFGNGISAVVDDLGAQGEWPTHPELLDWLATEFMDSGWDTKHMVKLMVMSATYRQSSNPRPEIHELDPANRLFASQSPRRLEAEFVRDNALFVSGLLNTDIGGPSVFPYQPAGYYANIQFPNREYIANTDDREYRRGVYMHWQRTFLQPMLANFDAPSREECTAIRNVSNSPQQMLTLLNDPTFVEAARMLAAEVLSVPKKNDDERLNIAYQKVLARDGKSEERDTLKKFLAMQRDYYSAHVDDAKKLMHVGNAQEPDVASDSELAAWTQVCRVMLSLHETITRY